MKIQRVALVALAVLATIVFGVNAQAGPVPVDIQTGDTLIFTDSYGSTSGGEFNVNIVRTAASLDFITFCVETNEYLSFGGSGYKVGSITTNAIKGGVGGGSPDPLDKLTAYLYREFHAGTLGSGATAYDYVNPGQRVSDANELQNLIWKIEQEISWVIPSGSKAEAWYNEAVLNADASLMGVRVINLKYLDGTLAQDVLVYVPEPTSVLFLLGIGLAGYGVSWIRRKS